MFFQQTVSSFVQTLTSGRALLQIRFGNVMSQSVMYNTARFDCFERSGRRLCRFCSPWLASQNEDLFLYRRTGVTMKKGDRARFSIFNSTAPYEHILSMGKSPTA